MLLGALLDERSSNAFKQFVAWCFDTSSDDHERTNDLTSVGGESRDVFAVDIDPLLPDEPCESSFGRRNHR